MTAYQTLNPTTGKVEKTFSTHTDAEKARFLDVAQETYRSDWRRRSIAERCAVVSRAAAILRRDLDRHAGLITTEMGKLFTEARGEVEFTAQILEYYAREAEKFLAPQKLAVDSGKAVLLSQPLGIIYCIEPWNYPYYQLARVAAPNLVAGNVVIAKHAPNVPQCAEAFAALFPEAGGPQGIYTNVFLSNDQSAELIADSRVRGVALTGSERAGRAVAAQAGAALKKDTMELGGSDAFIVLEDADLDRALGCAVRGRMSNNGQVCTAAKRMIVHESVADTFIARLKEKVEAFRPGDPMAPESTHGPMSSEKQLDLTLSQIGEAVKGGATLVTGGERIRRDGFFMTAAILTGVTKDNPVYYQEIFGPVATVYRVGSEREAIDLANDSPYGLGGTVFTKDADRGYRIAEEIETGMVSVNANMAGSPALPFGGVKNSGYGRELSSLGIEEFLNKKLIRVA
ncbi:NAD-dependent succinate-semialdehyde dehydrogenase [Acetobacter oeni]|uniref:Aldehyde dehydrogenase n=1 Tax=Acetobacter oeni TaxID=304077 RepID=A0A511XMF4_9PROT|nr:NAD-dependent succinate-semialdehyde dehydrogenase [Acetobacter oeni]MBB3883672.1 succinate-semialdehyde dehydrogenase/glutarate-semialdehyde dehydrogenase [Acetobacter oeni]NHO19745.1 aldehyde dehydrogenase family protein [Acetobacter oeni]GBR02907.1 aldehyde dehydrogenase [Acetobacter oeni LMG 21952]GEN64127.1 aldehyde dehydrogenase [Acetobacter oeni]